MPNNIIQIDLTIIDKEIAEIESKISDLQEQLEFRKNLKKYATKNNFLMTSAFNNFTPPPFHNKTPEFYFEHGLGISEFILKFLKLKNRAESSDIIEAYAKYTDEKREDIRGNVANALQRLKESKISYESHGNGRKGGGVWFLKN